MRKKLKILVLKLNDGSTKIDPLGFYFQQSHFDQQCFLFRLINFLSYFEIIFGYPSNVTLTKIKEARTNILSSFLLMNAKISI